LQSTWINILLNNSVFRLFIKYNYFTSDVFCSCIEIVFSKNFDVCTAFIFSRFDLDEEKLLERKNVEIILYYICGRDYQKTKFSLIDDLLDNVFDTEYLDYKIFKTKIESENSDLLLIVLTFFYQRNHLRVELWMIFIMKIILRLILLKLLNLQIL
jgi:hypothetical protein